ncbi:hypothetical protein E4634_14775 [Mangrovimicrobium sediminis]|uniref:Cytochrome c domain-containing protein n=1 Tax=Mangrovimicrobium sediminis TaxID=2562682 RepID=A0A4Z0M031_9GAMM|nr:hypothetical protein [Haliea sp. SAOS-164]TGD72777.1 hypothetical protein E4634_14775 [Haliea sp. SAOS-164]
MSACLLGAALSACGGGGGGGDNTPTPTPTPEPPAPAPTPTPRTAAFPCGSAGATLSADQAPGSYVLFESGPVRPLAISPDGQQLLVTNTPAGCLEIYDLQESGFTLRGAVAVGLEPVAVAYASNDEAWVVNQLSDSVSVVDLSAATPHVRQTLQVGDEPQDIVFAGPERRRAFITAAYRGQNHPTFKLDDFLTPGLGRADVWVYDTQGVDQSLNGNPLAIVNLFADAPRALSVSPDGATVYAAAFRSGNRTTTLFQDVVAGAKPEPGFNFQGTQQPATGLIVRNNGNGWLDEEGTDWSSEVRFSLPDYDVFAIDAMGEVPALQRQVSGVGTVLFNMAVNPSSGELYVSNLEARNEVRFEGPGERATTVRGRISESRISVVNNDAVTTNHLNPHIDFAVPQGASYPANQVQRSLSQPTALAVSPEGDRLYVAAFGSGKVAAIPTAQLREGKYEPNAAFQVQLPDGGPAGLALSADGERLVVYTRFDNAISLWNTADGSMLARRRLFTPEPAAIIDGRRFLYDAAETSANGTSACASCHIFGDVDHLAWDLGNPDAPSKFNPNEYVARSPNTTPTFHPMKGPMTTQTLRGIADSGPQHWRGDRTGENRAVVNGEQESIEAAAFKEFNPAFVELVGRAEELDEQDMQAFTDFAMALTPPPNPVRRLDNSLTAAQAHGREIYFEVGNITGIGSCNHCHSLDPQQKQFGTGGLMSFEGAGIDENFKIPHLRNAYAKVGMFGTSGGLTGDGVFRGDQVRGFGYLHDGSIATLVDFLSSSTFMFPAPVEENRLDVVRFVLAMDSNLAPVAGQQVTLAPGSAAGVLDRLTLMEQRADVTEPRAECDLVVRGVMDGLRFSALRQTSGDYLDTAAIEYSSTELRDAAAATGNALTFTCVPPGSGARLALDTAGG